MKIIAVLAFLVLFGCVPTGQTSSSGVAKTLRLDDFTYEPEIRTVTLRPPGADIQNALLPAVTEFGDWNLILGFDDLRTGRDSYFATIIHCNYDWTRSTLQDLDFLTDFNEFPILNFEYSVDTHIPYLHYQFQLPPVKLPGNYVVAVYRGSDRNDLLLTRRFMVFQQQVTFQGEQNLIGPGSVARLNQQINFTVRYPEIEIINPMQSVHVNIRQNQRWDNVAQDVEPFLIQEIQKELEYRFIEPERMFKGGNEFRFFDIRSLNYPGQNVARVLKDRKPFEVFLAPDRSRQGTPYAQYLDLNGQFIVQNLDYQGQNYAHYAFVHFTLQSKPLPGEVYVTGAFNYWNLNEENRMTYDSAAHAYTLKSLLKQGWYDYQYLVKAPKTPPFLLEGTHFETENSYEIFFYYRPFKPNADLLIGYQRFERNERDR